MRLRRVVLATENNLAERATNGQVVVLDIATAVAVKLDHDCNTQAAIGLAAGREFHRRIGLEMDALFRFRTALPVSEADVLIHAAANRHSTHHVIRDGRHRKRDPSNCGRRAY